MRQIPIQRIVDRGLRDGGRRASMLACEAGIGLQRSHVPLTKSLLGPRILRAQVSTTQRIQQPPSRRLGARGIPFGIT